MTIFTLVLILHIQATSNSSTSPTITKSSDDSAPMEVDTKDNEDISSQIINVSSSLSSSEASLSRPTQLSLHQAFSPLSNTPPSLSPKLHQEQQQQQQNKQQQQQQHQQVQTQPSNQDLQHEGNRDPYRNMPHSSLMAFLPPYVSWRQQELDTAKKSSYQGPIIGQFIRKDPVQVNVSNSVPMISPVNSQPLTPNIVLAGHSHPFQFNIPFTDDGRINTTTTTTTISTISAATDHFKLSSVAPSWPPDKESTLSTSEARKAFACRNNPERAKSLEAEDMDIEIPLSVSHLPKHLRVIPDITITCASSGTPSPMTDSPFNSFPADDDVILPLQDPVSSDSNNTPIPVVTDNLTSSSSSTFTLTSSTSSAIVMSTSVTEDKVSVSHNSGKNSAIEFLLQESANSLIAISAGKNILPCSEDKTQNPSSVPTSAALSASSQPAMESEGTTAPVPVGRTRRLSSGKSRFLKRQRSMEDDSVHPSWVDEDVFPPKVPALETIIEDFSTSQQKVSQDYALTSPSQSIIPVSSSISSTSTSTVPQKTTASSVANMTITSSSSSKQVLDSFSSTAGKTRITSCVICSENFSEESSFTAHLNSKKHINILESLGMLPAGTYEKLKNSEEQHKKMKREESEDRKIDHRLLAAQGTVTEVKPGSGPTQHMSILRRSLSSDPTLMQGKWLIATVLVGGGMREKF